VAVGFRVAAIVAAAGFAAAVGGFGGDRGGVAVRSAS
jgi:hypothetical protein